MLSDAVRLVHCPRCLGSDIHLFRPLTAWDSVLLPAPILCHSCATRFHTRLDLTQLPARIAPGVSPCSVPETFPIVEPRASAVLVVDDLIPFSIVVRQTFVRRGFKVLGAKSPDEAMALFQAHEAQIGLAVIGLVMPAAVNLDLTADLEHLRPGLPVLYLVGEGKSIARCSIEAQAPGSVLAVPFTEEQFIARVSSLLDADGTSHQKRHERLWERLIAASERISSGTAMLHVYELQQGPVAAGHAALLTAGGIHHAFQPTNCETAPYSMTVRAQDVIRARCLIEQASVDRPLVAAA
jgi:FixJ family two-component response regulator